MKAVAAVFVISTVAYATVSRSTLQRRAAAADRDSFPVTVVRPAVLPSLTLVVKDSVQLCALARNRYTGWVVIVADARLSDRHVAALAQACEPMRQAYQAERPA
jgi:hypothetical protein